MIKHLSLRGSECSLCSLVGTGRDLSIKLLLNRSFRSVVRPFTLESCVGTMFVLKGDVEEQRQWFSCARWVAEAGFNHALGTENNDI